jgi:hypothetical protein
VKLHHVPLSRVKLVVKRRHALDIAAVIGAAAASAAIGSASAALSVLLQAVDGRTGFAPAVSESLLVAEGVAQCAPDLARFLGGDGSERRLSIQLSAGKVICLRSSWQSFLARPAFR